VHSCVEDAVRIKMNMDQQEEEEIKKRRHNVILHGLAESAADCAEDKWSHDESQVLDLLHEIQCDDVSIDKIIRLGKRPEDQSAKPRPLMLVAASEDQKDKILRSAKKLEGKAGQGTTANIPAPGFDTESESSKKAIDTRTQRQEIAGRTELLGQYLKDMFTTEDTKDIPVETESKSDWSDTNADFSVDSIIKKLQKLPTDKSPGPDGIHNLLLHNCAAEVAEPLSLISKTSFESGILPGVEKCKCGSNIQERSQK